MDQVNPLIPAAYDVIWTVALVLVAVLTLAALTVLAFAWRRLPLIDAIVWLVVIFALPLAGPVVWLIYAALTTRRKPTTP